MDRAGKIDVDRMSDGIPKGHGSDAWRAQSLESVKRNTNYIDGNVFLKKSFSVPDPTRSLHSSPTACRTCSEERCGSCWPRYFIII